MPNPFLQALGKQETDTTPSISSNPFLTALSKPNPVSVQPTVVEPQKPEPPLWKKALGYVFGGVPALGINPLESKTAKNVGEYALEKFPGLTQSLADLQTNPLSLGSSLKEIIKTPYTDVLQASDSFNQTVSSFITGIKTNAPASKKIADAIQAGTALAGAAILPISTWFNMASKVPVVGSISKLLFNIPFATLGDVSGDTGIAALNQIPDSVLSPQAKQNLAPAIQAASTLAGQIIGGRYVAVDVLGALEKQFGKEGAKAIETKAKEMASETTLQDIQKKQSEKLNLRPQPVEGKPFSDIKPNPFMEAVGLGTKEIPKVGGAPEISKSLEPLAAEARKYKSADEFIQSVRLKSMIDSGEKQVKNEVWKGADNPKEQKAIIERNLAGAKEEYAKLPAENKLAGQTVDLLNKIDTSQRGWFNKATDFYNKATKEIPIEKPIITETAKITTPLTEGGKISGVAKTIEAKAVESGLIKNGFNELAEYSPAKIKEQAPKIADLMNLDIERAKRYSIGKEQIPPELGIRSEALFSAMRDYAMEKRDGRLMLDLAKSPIASEISAAGSKLSLSRPTTEDSAFSKIQQVHKELEKVAEKRLKGKSPDKVKEAIKTSLKEKIAKAKPSKYSWEAFIKEITC